MAERDIITMSQKELKQLHVIHEVLQGSLTQKQTAEVVSFSERQIRRIVRRIGAEGDKGIQQSIPGQGIQQEAP